MTMVKKRKLWFIVPTVLLWSLPMVVGFLAALTWQGLVVGWRTYVSLMRDA